MRGHCHGSLRQARSFRGFIRSRRDRAGGLGSGSGERQGSCYFGWLQPGTRYAGPIPTIHLHFHIGQIDGLQRWFSSGYWHGGNWFRRVFAANQHGAAPEQQPVARHIWVNLKNLTKQVIAGLIAAIDEVLNHRWSPSI